MSTDNRKDLMCKLYDAIPEEHQREYERILDAIGISASSELAPLLIACQHYKAVLSDSPKQVAAAAEVVATHADAIKKAAGQAEDSADLVVHALVDAQERDRELLQAVQALKARIEKTEEETSGPGWTLFAFGLLLGVAVTFVCIFAMGGFK